MCRITSIKIIICFMLISLLIGCSDSNDTTTAPNDPGDVIIDPYEIEPSSIDTFIESDSDDICREDGKPIIRLFSTTWCSHCQWVADTFDDVVQMYVDEGLIVAHHWELDIDDDTLTSQIEESIPESEEDIFEEFNPQRSIPTFVFGCRYYRVGTGHETEDDLEAEAAEFMAVIERHYSMSDNVLSGIPNDPPNNRPCYT